VSPEENGFDPYEAYGNWHVALGYSEEVFQNGREASRNVIYE